MSHISRSALIKDLQDKTHEVLKNYIRPGENLAILDFPDIKNCGDSAIWLGEMAYLRDRHAKRPDYVSRGADFSAADLRKASPTGPVFIHGGGNFGDIWEGHQDFRERLLEELKDRKIVQFPQSIHYQSEARIEQTKRAIGKHRNFVLLVRDQESYDFSQKHFDCELHLCPDMALCIGEINPSPPEHEVLAMLREDKEQAAGANASNVLDIPKEDWITETRYKVRWAKARGVLSALLDRPSEMRLRMLDSAANHRFRRGITQISRGKAIVTDRLHVHICSLLIGRPHAVLDNNYGKIRRFMDAFSGRSDLSYKAQSLEDGINWARERAGANA